MNRLVCVLLAVVFAAGCVQFPSAGTIQSECLPEEGRPDPSGQQMVRGQRAVVKVVQFTDDGEYTDRCALTDVLLELKVEKPQIVVLYVHGWKHNGFNGDPDLIEFGRAIETLALNEAAAGRDRRVVGIYVGWNAKRTRLPILKELTFWGRKRAADRVSQSAAVTRLLGAVDNISAQRRQPGDLTIYAGHSFGARILYSATAQLLVHKLQMAHPGIPNKPYENFSGTGDLVLLINPAFEASLYSVFAAQQARWQETFLPSQKPVLLAISAENDKATKSAFPLGQIGGLEFSKVRRTTLGNYSDYVTHRLAPCVANLSQSCVDTSFEHFCAAGACLTRQEGKSLPYNPFIVAQADPSLVDGHGGIWKPQFREWLASFIAQLDERKASEARQR